MSLINKLIAVADAIRVKTGTTERMTLDEMAAAIEGISGSGGGSAEIPTCTVKFVVGEYGEYYSIHSYTKCVNGVISTENFNDGSYETKGEGTEIVLENVVCDSIIYFSWSYNWDAGAGDVWIDGNAEVIEMSNIAVNESCLFKAQSEPNSISTITVMGTFIDDSGGWEE